MLISNFLIKGNATEGERIEINYEKTTKINLNYTWQINNGFQWIVVSRFNFYDIKKNDVNKKLKCVITYFDKDKYLESMTTKIWIINEKLKLERIDGKEDKLFLTFNENVTPSKNLKLNLSNGMIAEYISNVKSNIIEFKILNYKKNNKNISISSIEGNINTSNNSSIEDRYKNINVNFQPPSLKMFRDVESFNSKSSINFIFLSTKVGKIIYTGISDSKFSLENAKVEGKNSVNVTNIKDGKYILLVKVIDIAGNQSEPLKINPFTVWTKEAKLNKISISSTNKDNQLAKKNDIVKFNIVPDDFVKIMGVQIMKKYVNFTTLNDGSYSAEYKIHENDTGKIKFNIRFRSLTGKINSSHITTDDSYVLIDNEIPSVLNAEIKSESDSKDVKLNDIINLKVEFSKDVDPYILIFDKIASIDRINNKNFIASIKIDDSIDYNFDHVFKIDSHSFSGVNGETYISKDNTFNILLDKPVLTEIRSIGITNNSSPIYIFDSNEEGKLYLSEKMSTDAIFVRKGNNCIKFINLENGVYNESLYVENKLGNRSKLDISEFKITKSSSILELLNLSMKTDNKNNKIARIGNIVSVMFTTNKKIKNIDIDFEINNKKIYLIKKIENIFNECFWSIEFEVNPNIPYGNILLNLKVQDYDDCVLSYKNLNKDTQVMIVNPNYENLKPEFDLLHNKLDNIDTYIDNMKLDQYNNIINVIEQNIFPNDVYYLWQDKVDDKWIDIQSSYESFYEINDLDVGKTLRVKIYFIDENKNLNLKYSEEFKITENNNKVITIN